MPDYNDMAIFTARFPELLILRRFDELTCKVVLAQQAELLYLERELSDTSDLEEKHDPGLVGMSASWRKTRQAYKDGRAEEQRKLFDNVKEKLLEYHETLLRISKVQKLGKPTKRNQLRMSKWLEDDDGGAQFLTGCEAAPWDRYHPAAPKISRDLATVVPAPDALDTWLRDTWVHKWHSWFGHRQKANVAQERGIPTLWEYNKEKLHRWGNVICVLISALVPIASIWPLYWTPTSLGRLGLVSGFIVIFAAMMIWVPGCRRLDIFAATAGFAALQVVFLQGLTGVVNCN